MMQNSIKIAITGGIGSGKSTVADIIREQGYDVLSCDDIYKQLLKDKNFVKKLAVEFGDILTEEQELDRRKLSAVVFSDKQKLIKLNNLTHPQIMKKAFEEMKGKPVCFCEVPLLFEGGYEKFFDKIIVVTRDLDSRINSVAKRDKISVDEVKNRINNQYNYEISSFEKYYVIHNNLNFAYLRDSVMKIISSVKNLK